MKNRHILFLASWYPSRVFPYLGDFIQRHVLAASLMNRITVVYSIKDNSLKKDFEIVESNKEIREVIVYFRGSFFRPFNLIKKIWGYRKELKRTDSYDLVHLNVCYPAGIFALFLKYFYHKKYLLSEHWAELSAKKFETYPSCHRFIIQKIFGNSEVPLPVSEDLGRSLLRIAPGKKIEVIPNVVDTEKFRPYFIENTGSKVRFLHLSALDDKQKNITGMLNVAKRLAEDGHQFEFHIGGNGDLKGINRFVEKNNLQDLVIPFPTVPYDQVGRFINQFDGFALFSNYENQPCVQGESISCGVPFIGSGINGIPEFLPSGFGTLVSRGNEAELYNAIVDVIKGRKFESKEKMHQYSV